MRYLGGKQRIAKQIVAVLNQYAESCDTLYEPFVGGANIGIYTKFKYIHCSDRHEDLILMYKALQEGWEPPEVITETEYLNVKESIPSPLRGFVGFGVSFGGKWFAGYARDNTGRNYAKNAASSLRRKVKDSRLREATFTQKDFLAEFDEVKGAVFYLDPPYAGTTRYAFDFDHALFWEKVRKLSQDNVVLISEYNAPEDFECILEIETKTDLRTANKQRGVRTEKVFRLRI